MKKIFVCCGLILLIISIGFGQKRAKTKLPSKPKPIVFAVLNDGQTLEPIGEINKGELTDVSASSGDVKVAAAFANSYYKPNATYDLIFGGQVNGKVTVKNADPKSECGKNLATVTTQSVKAKLKGMVMGLATNDIADKTAKGVRRMPTPAERSEIEALVRAEFAKQSVSSAAIKTLKYHNLTALDVDNDGKAEIVGSFWVDSSPKERNLLFFIADKGSDGSYSFGYSDYKKVTPEEIMSGEMKDLDSGIGNELLIDAMEYNGDSTAEIFTITQSFEGNNFQVYSRQNGKWKKVYEGYNYHCAF